jgi:hypothetical protein
MPEMVVAAVQEREVEGLVEDPQELSATTAPEVELQHLAARVWVADEQSTVQAPHPASVLEVVEQSTALGKAESEVPVAAQRQPTQSTEQVLEVAGRVPEQLESATTLPSLTQATERVWEPEPQSPPETEQEPYPVVVSELVQLEALAWVAEEAPAAAQVHLAGASPSMSAKD